MKNVKENCTSTKYMKQLKEKQWEKLTSGPCSKPFNCTSKYNISYEKSGPCSKTFNCTSKYNISYEKSGQM